MCWIFLPAIWGRECQTVFGGEFGAQFLRQAGLQMLLAVFAPQTPPIQPPGQSRQDHKTAGHYDQGQIGTELEQMAQVLLDLAYILGTPALTIALLHQ